MDLKKWRKWLVASILISMSSLAIIFAFSSTKKAIPLILSIPLWFFLIIILVHFLHWLFWAVRIKIMAHALGENISIMWAFRIVMVNLFMASVTPSSIGGEPSRIYLLSQGNLSSGDATALILSERLLDFIFFAVSLPLFILLLGISINLEDIAMELFVAIGLFLLGGLALIYIIYNASKIKSKIKKLEKLLKFFIKEEDRRERLIHKVEKEFDTFVKSVVIIFKRKKVHFIAAMSATAIMWFADFTIPSLILLGMGYPPFWLLSITFQMIILLITIIPISPGGSGLAEFSAYFLYSQKLQPDITGALVILWRVLTFYLNLFGGMIYTVHYISKGK